MSFGTGLSGLNAASKNLDVIGHNIANANTTGMKAGRAEFAEMYAASLGAAGGSNGGIGVSVATVAQQFTQGNLKVTGNNLDMAVNGEGFFKVSLTDGSTAYTRNGEFKMDTDGYLITNNGAKVHGYLPTTPGGVISTGETGLIRFPTGGIIPAKQTTEVKLAANLDSRVDVVRDAPVGPATIGAPRAIPAAGDTIDAEFKKYGTALLVYDKLGNPISVQVYFVKHDPTANPNTWEALASLDGKTVYQSLGTVKFNAADENPPPDPPAKPYKAGYPENGAAFTPLTITANATTGIPSADMTVNINLGTGPDNWSLSQFGTSFAVYDISQDGYTAGELVSIATNEKGVISARYSNGTEQNIAQVALARFRNVQGLQPINGGYWTVTANSGNPIEGQPQTGRFGLIRSGALEESNVDLTQELVNMIVAQRHYQANAQTIKTQDQVQQTLVNLR